MCRFGFINSRDSSHDNSFVAIALLLNNKFEDAEKYIKPVRELLFKSIIFPIKNPDYFWSNSGSENSNENTFFVYKKVLGFNIPIGFGRFTYCFQQRFLRHLGIDPHKGSNPDQMFPYIVYNCLTRNHKELWKILLGLIIRLGFFPNFEHIIFKPMILAPIARLYKIFPLYWVLDALELVSSVFILRKSISQETTKKIKLFLYLVNSVFQKTIFIKKILYRIKHERIVLTQRIYGHEIEDYFVIVFNKYFNQVEQSIIIQNMLFHYIEDFWIL